MSAGALNDFRNTASAFWEERNPRERNILLAAGALILLALIYMLLIDPALSGRQRLERSLPELRQQAAELQRLTSQASKLSTTPAPPPMLLTKENVEAALSSHGLKADNTLVTGDVVKLQLNNASFSSIIAWLDDMQKNARLSVTDASFDAQAAQDTVNASLTLRQQRNDAKSE